ncbi:hypothetical protein [Amycolatopsis panacis]|uniref:Uncharacterized protein n=1 Tax=Amycolatopsis panacis TaxID=2340917 RepID=A0A419I355_9PSEU|nr:hypothetical protein [Amycolatopsis panacis]RJQ84456.1 hypothetical protein D5S19_17710 [Amycolatopsis panacis]
MEIYRTYGIADAVTRAGAPFDAEAGVARCETLAGEWQWLYDAEEPRGLPDLTASSGSASAAPGSELSSTP